MVLIQSTYNYTQDEKILFNFNPVGSYFYCT